MTGSPRRMLEQRLFAKLVIDPSGCLLWTGPLEANGYGRVWLDGRRQFVHRLMYTEFVGPIPDGFSLDHLCRVRHCASPDHLEPVTNRRNVLRGTGPSAVNAAKDVCGHGHEFDLANTYVSPDGRRHCRTCQRAIDRGRNRAEYARNWRARKKAK